MFNGDLYRSSHLSSIGKITNVVLRDLDLQFLVMHLQKSCSLQIFLQDLPQLTRPLPWSCSCYFYFRSQNSLELVEVEESVGETFMKQTHTDVCVDVGYNLF